MSYPLIRTDGKVGSLIDDLSHILKDIEDNGFDIHIIMEAVDDFIEENNL